MHFYIKRAEGLAGYRLFTRVLCNGYTMGCAPVRADSPRALIIFYTGGQIWYN